MKHVTGMMMVLLVSLSACGKSNDNKPAEKVAPQNLTVNTVVSTDSSGTVTFTAVADHAVSYDYDFGNGYIRTTANGSTSYTYNTPGANTYKVQVTAKSADGLTTSQSVSVVVPVSTKLLWSDEFNQDGAPDPKKWGYDIGTGDNGWGNAEAQYYTDRQQNVSVSDGTLKIIAQKESYNGKDYTSARMLTKGKFNFTYGRVEVSAKLPVGGGTWPAIWMLGSNIATAGWPACGEIDIMEHKGNEPQKIYGTVHHPDHAGANGDGGTTMVANETGAFHKYTLDWSPKQLRWYVDDKLYFTFNNAAGLPFNHDFFILLNFAVGGTFGGAIDPAFTKGVMEVDYVRVYKN
ncbi:family 16 glycosylhydrolase [Chitinophaga qingshengii]|uniref:Family 16 glycosylhydrolase n=1 Tax=Chitinophaga qingshengii TaxID=1569794 RepID=A0ABR7TMH4_9BACT|nr:family 16 glycosylhydrolase [Chitinophaga qingshengii]MBC9930614.1 family 16 glycosylhydrolase [Chitinophaga qingshengii]